VKTFFSYAVAVAAAVTLAGCETIIDVPAGQIAVGDSFQATTAHEWADISKTVVGAPANVRLLSIDGPLLNRLYIVGPMAPGDAIVKAQTKDVRTPTYRAAMSPNEMVELVTDTVAALDYQRPESSGLRPAKFAGENALRFDLAAKTKDGLNISGTAETAEIGGKLYVVLYLAPSEHYYAATLPEIEGILASARRKG
jgi:hypothetical protein